MAEKSSDQENSVNIDNVKGDIQDSTIAGRDVTVHIENHIDKQNEVHASGGTYIKGPVDTGGGTFVGRDVIQFGFIKISKFLAFTVFTGFFLVIFAIIWASINTYLTTIAITAPGSTPTPTLSPTPFRIDRALSVFPDNPFSIIVAEFTYGANERSIYKKASDIQDKIYRDIKRSLLQDNLSRQISIQKAGVIRDERQAKNIGAIYNADLIVWGYVPYEQPNSFRPTFTITSRNIKLKLIDPIIFGVDINGEDIIETSSLLTKRVQTVSSFILGLIYLYDGMPHHYEMAASIFTQAIEHTEQEYLQNKSSKDDLGYNLALFLLLRGRIYAGLGEINKALADYTRSLKYERNLVETHVALGNLYYEQGKFNDAQSHYMTVKNTGIGNLGLGLVAYNQGDYNLAKNYLEKSLSLLPDEDFAYKEEVKSQVLFTVGITNKQLEKIDDAIGALEIVCSNDSPDSSFSEIACLELTRIPHDRAVTSIYTPSPTPISISPLLSPTRMPPPRMPTSTRIPTPTRGPTLIIRGSPFPVQGVPAPNHTLPPPVVATAAPP